jgi:heptosyltransferase I
MKILVVKMTSMGDVVHTLPAVTDMARALPGARIDWLVEAPFAGIAKLHPAVRRVIPVSLRKWRKRWWAGDVRAAVRQAKALLRQERYDLIIDFQGLLKSAWWARKAIGPVAGYDAASMREPLAALLYHRKTTVEKNKNAVARNRQLAAQHLGYTLQGAPDFGIAAALPPLPLAGEGGGRDWGFEPHAASQSSGVGVLADTRTAGEGDGATRWHAPQPYAVLMPAASRVEKLWPQNDWLAVIAALQARGLTIVLLWGSDAEKARADDLAAQTGTQTRALVPPFLSVADAAGVLAAAKIVVGLDTGFTHLAAALNVPTIGIYCDHDPGLAAVTGNAFTASLGGKGTPPARAAVLGALAQALPA